jgi:hypothetical protein
MDEPPRLLHQLAEAAGKTQALKFLEEGVPKIF